MEEKKKLEEEIIKIIRDTVGYEVKDAEGCLLEAPGVNVCDWIPVIDRLQKTYGDKICNGIAGLEYWQFTVEGIAGIIL